MNIKQLQYVLVLADKGSFVKASDALGISQPSLSQYIKKIEEQVGMQLFDRTGSDVRLTDAGKVYVDISKKILDLNHQMQNRFSDIAAYKEGTIIVGTSPYRSAAMMPQIVKSFRDKYPGMHIVVEEMTSLELIDATEHGKFDLCLTVGPVSDRLFNYEKVSEEEILLAVPTSYLELESKMVPGKKYPVIDASQLSGCSFIKITESQVMQGILDDICFDYGLDIKTSAIVKSLEAQISMVRAGVGMALVPSGIETFCLENEVRFYSFKQDFPKREVVAMWRKDRVLNQATRDLLEVMKKL